MSKNMEVKPGYSTLPSQLFGQQVDTSFWNGVAAAGQGPVTSATPESPEIACLRTAPNPFRICARVNYAW